MRHGSVTRNRQKFVLFLDDIFGHHLGLSSLPHAEHPGPSTESMESQVTRATVLKWNTYTNSTTTPLSLPHTGHYDE